MTKDVYLNVMHDAWLPVIMEDDTKKDVSLYEAIDNAQHIKKIQNFGQNPMENYAVAAFIFDFVQWVYKPIGQDEDEKREAILELFEKGQFDTTVLDEYIEEYESTRSFDIFDEKYPFLQVSTEEWNARPEKENLTSLTSPIFGVNYLSGNNVTFEHPKNYVDYQQYLNTFGDSEQGEYAGKEIAEKGIERIPITLKSVELIASILWCMSYKQSNGKGSYASVLASKDAHPIGVICEGKNLFETICLSMGVAESYNAKPIWERDKYVMTSTDLMQKEIDNSIALTYTPTVILHAHDFSAIYTKTIQEDRDFQKIIKSESKKDKEFNLPKHAYSKWVEKYPRIIRKRWEDKKGNKYVKALTYTYENLLSSEPELETNLLQLECDSKECDIVNINYMALEDKTDITIHYYALAYKSASQNTLTNYGKEFHFDKPLNDYTELRFPNLLEFMANVAKITATSITELDFACRTRNDDSKEIKAMTKGKLSLNALSETDCTLKQCLYELEHGKYEELISPDKTVADNLYDWIAYEFFNTFDEHEKYLPKHSLLKYAEMSDKYKATINNIKKEYKEE